MRGTGDLLGRRQHGRAPFVAASLARDRALLERARDAAQQVLVRTLVNPRAFKDSRNYLKNGMFGFGDKMDVFEQAPQLLGLRMVFPPTQESPNAFSLRIESFNNDGLRRMIYAHKVRMERAPIFGAFDCPDAGQTMPRRRQSTTAIQALNLFNGAFVIDQAAAFATRVRSEAGDASTAEKQVTRAYQLAFGRHPSEAEAESSRALVNAHGLAALCRVLYNSNEFLFLP